MTDKTKEALKLALEALQEVYWSSRSAKHDEAIAALREALAEQPAIKQDLTPEQLAQRKPWVGPTDFIKHEVENAYDWSEWVCPDPESYLMKCCDCGLVHEAQFRVAKYKPAPSDECEVVSDPDLQAQFRMRRSEQWSPADTAHRSGGLPMAEQPAPKWQGVRFDSALHDQPAQPQQKYPNEADELIRNLGFDPDLFRTEAGFINHMKLRAAIERPEEYQAAMQPMYQKLTNCVVCGRLNPNKGTCDHGVKQPAIKQDLTPEQSVVSAGPITPAMMQGPTPEQKSQMVAAMSKLAEESSGTEQPEQQGCMRCNTPKKCALYGCSPLTWPSEQPAQQEPVAWLDEEKRTIYWHNTHDVDDYHGFKRTTPLYKAPPASKPLTDEEIAEMMMRTWGCASIAPRHAPAFARAVEAAHGIKE